MDDLLQQGITAYKAGKRDEARRIFIDFVKQSPNDERAWGWMYSICNTDKERIDCLRQMVRINPKNEKANLLLNQLANFQPSQQLSASSISTNNIQNPDPSLKKCPYCAETIQASAIVCRFCGRDLRTGIVNVPANLPSAQPTKTKKWYMTTPIKILTFLFITPLWTLIVLDDPDESVGIKILAGILLVVYILFVCPMIYGILTRLGNS